MACHTWAVRFAGAFCNWGIMFPIIVRVPKACLFVLYQSGHHGGSAGHGPCEEVGLHGAEAGLPGGTGRLSWGLVVTLIPRTLGMDNGGLEGGEGKGERDIETETDTGKERERKKKRERER